MGYFRELPNIAFQTPLAHKNSSRDYVLIKNLFRRTKIYDYLKDNISILDKFTIGIGDRPDMVAEELYGDPTLDYVVILVSGITNITHEWPMHDYQVYDFALSKYGSELEMNANHHYETFEIRDNNNRLILPPELIVDADFRIDGARTKYNTEYTLISQAGNSKLDDKDAQLKTQRLIEKRNEKVLKQNIENDFKEGDLGKLIQDVSQLNPNIPQEQLESMIAQELESEGIDF